MPYLIKTYVIVDAATSKVDLNIWIHLRGERERRKVSVLCDTFQNLLNLLSTTIMLTHVKNDVRQKLMSASSYFYARDDEQYTLIFKNIEKLDFSPIRADMNRTHDFHLKISLTRSFSAVNLNC